MVMNTSRSIIAAIVSAAVLCASEQSIVLDRFELCGDGTCGIQYNSITSLATPTTNIVPVTMVDDKGKYRVSKLTNIVASTQSVETKIIGLDAATGTAVSRITIQQLGLTETNTVEDVFRALIIHAIILDKKMNN